MDHAVLEGGRVGTRVLTAGGRVEGREGMDHAVLERLANVDHLHARPEELALGPLSHCPVHLDTLHTT
jgi:hypothetical protein